MGPSFILKIFFTLSCSQIIEMIRALDTGISVYCGQLVVHGYNSCEIQHHDSLLKYFGPEKEVFPDPRFGLITYTCDHKAGYLTSDFDCNKCTFECSEESGSTSSESRQEAIQFWSGTILGVCFATLVGSYVFRRLYQYQTINPNSWFDCRWNLPCNVNKNVSTTDDDMMSDELFLKEGTRQHGDPYTCHSSVTDGVEVGDENNMRSSASASKKTFISVITGFLLFTNVKACDVIVIMAPNNVTTLCSGGSICDNSNSNTYSPFFYVGVGQEICIEDHLGAERVSLRLSEISCRLRYELTYFTSDYITHEPTVGGACCDSIEQCAVRHGACFDAAYAQLPEDQVQKNASYDSSCVLSRLIRGRTMRCIWFEQKEQIGELYGVYQKTGRTCSVKYSLKESNYSREFTLGNYDPTYQLTIPRLQEVGVVPLTVIDTFGETEWSILLHDNQLYYVNASVIHSPEIGRFGDLQISLDDHQKNFAPHTVTSNVCEDSGHDECVCNCSVVRTESMIWKFDGQKSDFYQPRNFIFRKNDSTVIDVVEPLTKSRTLMKLGNRAMSDHNQEALCGIEFLTSFGCTSCNESAYLIMIAQNIKKEGLIPFHSNCSFDRETIKCDYEPTKLILQGNYSHCYIRILKSKKQFYVNFKYPDFSHQFVSKKKICFSGYDKALGDLITSNTFIKTFILAAILCFIFGIVIVVALRTMHLRQNQYRVERVHNIVGF